MPPGGRTQRRAGRRPVTTREELAHIGLDLFLQNGFEATTVDDIASAAGIARRTFFSYFASKNDLAWGDFDAQLDGMRAYLADVPRDVGVHEALRASAIRFNSFPRTQVPHHRLRMRLLLTTPPLQAHAALRYAAWREVVAEFVAVRTGATPDALEPQTVAWAALGASLAAYERWLAHDDADLPHLLDRAYRLIDLRLGADA